MTLDLAIRAAEPRDEDGIWAVLEPVLREGATYALPRDWGRDNALGYWMGSPHQVYVATSDGAVLGVYFMQANQQGGGAHVANCGYVTAPARRGLGVASAMCRDSLTRAQAQGFRAMQFNFVVETNAVAVRLWTALGFETVGRLPGAFAHPTRGFVDALVMFRRLPGVG